MYNRESFLAVVLHSCPPKVGRLLVLILAGGDGGVSRWPLGAEVQALACGAVADSFTEPGSNGAKRRVAVGTTDCKRPLSGAMSGFFELFRPRNGFRPRQRCQ